MTEHGETSKPLNAFEAFKSLEERGYKLEAALGYEALAFHANNRTLAQTYFENAMQALDAEPVPAIYLKPPEPTAVYSRALTNLAPITERLVVGKELSGPEALKAVLPTFIGDLNKQADAAQRLLRSRVPEGSKLALQQAGLIHGFDVMSILALLYHHQAHEAESSSWMPHIAFLEPKDVLADSDNSRGRRWDINIYFGPSSIDFSLVYKAYIRWSKASKTVDGLDADTSVIYVNTDLALPDDKYRETELEIIKNLRAENSYSRAKIAERIGVLLEKLDEQTAGSLGL